MLRLLIASATTDAPAYRELGQQLVAPIPNVFAIMVPVTESVEAISESFPSENIESSSKVADFLTIATICVSNVPDWSRFVVDISEDIKVSALLQGLSSEVYKVSLISKDASVLYRVYSSYVGSFYDPSVELSAFKIASTFGLGPRYIASGIGWRIEEFLENFVILTPPLVSIRSVYSATAIELGKLHRVQKSSTFPSDFNSRAPSVFSRLSSWRDQAVKVLSYHINPTVLTGIDELLCERASAMGSNALGYHVVFSHNDLNLGNVMVSKPGRVRFIDFEYADMNFQGWDLATFFVSAPNLSLRDFLGEYLCEYLAVPVASVEQVDELEHSISSFVLEFHLMWGLWSVIRSEQKQGSFDFVKHADLRFGTYLSLRNAANIPTLPIC